LIIQAALIEIGFFYVFLSFFHLSVLNKKFPRLFYSFQGLATSRYPWNKSSSVRTNHALTGVDLDPNL
jgi:hypothetical protein